MGVKGMSLCLWIPLLVAEKLTVESQPSSLARALIRHIRAASIVLRPLANLLTAYVGPTWVSLSAGQKHHPPKRL